MKPTNNVRSFLITASTIAISIALAILLGNQARAQNIDQFERDGKKWIEDAKSVYRLDCEAKRKIWEAYCKQGDVGIDGQGADIDAARKTARDYQDQQKGQISDLLKKFSELKQQADNLVKAPATTSQVNSLLQDMQKEVKKLNNLEDDVVLKGADHPFVQYAIEYGKQMHIELCDKMRSLAIKDSPVVCEKQFERGFQPDAVFVNEHGLQVYEFKPDSSEAIYAGEKKLNGYFMDVAKYYQQFFEHLDGKHVIKKNLPSNLIGGMAMLEAILTYGEWRGNELVANPHVYAYSPCEMRNIKCVDN